MKAGKSMEIACSANCGNIASPLQIPFPRIVQPLKNQTVTIFAMDYKQEIGRRIRKAREEQGLTLSALAQLTGDILSGKRINAYENGDRRLGPAEAVILAKALRLRPAYVMALEDPQLPITEQEENMIRAWRKLPERDRMSFYRKIEQVSMAYADTAITDKHVSTALGKIPRAAVKK
jgi:transcriptional regulator with XRE-family HTH domain